MWDTKIRELIDRLFIEANGNKSAFEEALREADIEFVCDSEISRARSSNIHLSAGSSRPDASSARTISSARERLARRSAGAQSAIFL